MKFYDRETELALLQDLTERSVQYSQFTAIFGRRRIGKTELVRQHLQKRGIYFFVEKRPSNALLAEFSATLKSHIATRPHLQIGKTFSYSSLPKPSTNTWSSYSMNFKTFSPSNPPSIPSSRGVWDTWHKQSRIHLIAIGSVVGLMKKVFQDAKEPLYGRLTQEMDLSPLPIGRHLSNRHRPRLSIAHRHPDSLRHLWRHAPVLRNHRKHGPGRQHHPHILHQALFTPFAPFRNEMRDIILSEFGTPPTPIWQSSKPSPPAKPASLKSRVPPACQPRACPNTCANYPIYSTSSNAKCPSPSDPWKTKKSRYKIRDPFITFWMRFIYRQLSIYESGNFPYFLNRLNTSISEFMGFAFENITRELLIKLNHHNAAPFYFHRIGRWWDRQSEIDLVALNPETRQTLFVECKWTSTPVGPDVLQTLKHRAQNLPTSDAFISSPPNPDLPTPSKTSATHTSTSGTQTTSRHF